MENNVVTSMSKTENLQTRNDCSSQLNLGAIEQDVFIKNFLRNVPEHLAKSFSKEQLVQIKLKFGAKKQNDHLVDKRSVFNLGAYSYYLVFLLGQNRRSLTFAERKVNLSGKVFFFTSFSAMFLGVSILSWFLI